MQTIVWTRDLSKVDPREIETCEDLLDSYFLMVRFPWLALSIRCYISPQVSSAGNMSTCIWPEVLKTLLAGRNIPLHYFPFHSDSHSHLQADSTLSRLNVLREKIDDTEALITINLDSRRNDLVAFDLVSLTQSHPAFFIPASKESSPASKRKQMRRLLKFACYKLCKKFPSKIQSST